jgi:hypothetical protein
VPIIKTISRMNLIRRKYRVHDIHMYALLRTRRESISSKCVCCARAKLGRLRHQNEHGYSWRLIALLIPVMLVGRRRVSASLPFRKRLDGTAARPDTRPTAPSRDELAFLQST